MLKTLIAGEARGGQKHGRAWVDVGTCARVELTSEDPSFPVEGALELAGGSGWRAAERGEQIIRLRFDSPLRVTCVRLVFLEETEPRTQEFVLRWSDDGDTFREIVRQQYTFSPPGTTMETEEYEVELAGLVALELTIDPDVGAGRVKGSLMELRLAE